MDTCNVADILARYSKPRIKEPQDFSCPKTLKVVSVTFHAPLDLTIHDSQGMYDPGAEHDACGVGMVTTLNKRPERKIVDDAIEVQHALQTYREIHDELGLDGTPPFAGIPEIIRALHASGMPQSTATSKPESAARRVLHHYNLLNEFEAITGASEDESRSKKEDVVAEALRRLDALGVDLSNVLMIGDRYYDVQGSAQHGVPCVYVTWGYGRTGEDDGAVAVVNTAAQLAE